MSNDGSNKLTNPEADAVLEFWLGDCDDPDNVKRRGKLWFASTPEQDREVRERFEGLHERATRGELDHWTAAPRSTLALVVLLDQFTRNLYRRTSSAFANDPRSLHIAREAIERGFDQALHPVERAFLYMPFQHSEDMSDQDRSVRLYRELVNDCPESLKAFAGETSKFAELHRDLVKRFGRFPHRNDLLGRRNTEAERQYLEEGGHRFGQG
jgi:uncharacterized protein (DUF924 family)